MQTTTRHPIQTAFAVPAVGERNIYPAALYAGTVSVIDRVNTDYYSVLTYQAADRRAYQAVNIWRDKFGGYVVDYHNGSIGETIEVDRTHGLLPALAVAVWASSEHGYERGLW